MHLGLSNKHAYKRFYLYFTAFCASTSLPSSYPIRRKNTRGTANRPLYRIYFTGAGQHAGHPHVITKSGSPVASSVPAEAMESPSL